MDTKLIIIMTTVNTKEQSDEIIKAVLDKKYVACVQTREIESHYVWDNELCHDKEILIWLKTEDRMYGKIEQLLKDIHPYEVPEIISVPIENVSDGYMNWVKESIVKE